MCVANEKHVNKYNCSEQIRATSVTNFVPLDMSYTMFLEPRIAVLVVGCLTDSSMYCDFFRMSELNFGISFQKVIIMNNKKHTEDLHYKD